MLLLPPAPAVCLLFPRLCCRTRISSRPAEFGNPQSGVDVVEEDQAVARLRAPGEGHVGAETVEAAGPEVCDLASLTIEVAAQFARNVEHAPAAVVVAHVEDVV